MTRHAEDYAEGEVFDLGSVVLEEDAIIAFAREWDPQPFHLDPEAAKHTIFGGLIASGWHTALTMMRLMIDRGYLSKETSMGSPGIDELRWLKPVRAGDVLRGRIEVHGVSYPRSRGDIGFVANTGYFTNAAGEDVYRIRSTSIIRRRGGSA